MAIRKIPTTADIYLEVDGVRVAVVQSYKVTASRESKAIYAFGQSEPVTTIRGQSQYTLELTDLRDGRGNSRRAELCGYGRVFARDLQA